MSAQHLQSIRYETRGRIAYLTLNRPDRLNAIDDAMPREIAAAVEWANDDPAVHVIVLQGAGRAFCAGYDLKDYAEQGVGTQDVVWDPIADYRDDEAQHRRLLQPVPLAQADDRKVQGYAVAGGSDIALSCDLVVMAEDARIGYMPARVWGCPTTAMWVYRLGAERAKRMLLTGDTIDGRQAADVGPRGRGGAGRRARRAGRRAGRPDGRRPDQPARDAEADDQPGLRQHGPGTAPRCSPRCSTASPGTPPKGGGSRPSPPSTASTRP